MKKFLCLLVSVVLYGASAGFTTQKGGEERRVPVLMYHSVCKTNVGGYVVSPDTLRADFAYLHRKGYTAVFVRDIIDFCDGKGDLPPKPIVLTFDDGFYNNAYYAEKIAREYGMKIVVSVVGAYAQKENGQSKRSPVYSYLNAAEIAKMQAGGRVEFCNHTYDLHRTSGDRKGVRRKKNESASAYEDLIISDSEKCRNFLRGACGYTVNVFTYPFGCYSRETNGILQKLGYRAVLTCKGGVNVFRRGSTEGLYGIMRYNRTGTADTERFFASVKI